MRAKSFLLAWLASVSIAVAQEPLSAPTTPLQGAFTQADSATAVRRYFQLKRQGGAVLTIGAFAAPVAAYVSAGNQKDAVGAGLSYLFAPVAFAVPLGTWLFFRQYNGLHEERAVLALQEGHLSPKLRRKLKPTYFPR